MWLAVGVYGGCEGPFSTFVAYGVVRGRASIKAGSFIGFGIGIGLVALTVTGLDGFIHTVGVSGGCEGPFITGTLGVYGGITSNKAGSFVSLVAFTVTGLETVYRTVGVSVGCEGPGSTGIACGVGCFSADNKAGSFIGIGLVAFTGIGFEIV